MNDVTGFNNLKVLGTIQLGNTLFDAQGLADLLQLVNGQPGQRAATRSLVDSLNSMALPPLTNPVWRSAFIANAPAGDNDLYTCPVNRRAIVVYFSSLNLTGAGVVIHPRFKNGGTYYRAGTNVTNNANSMSFGFLAQSYPLEAGETFTVNTAALGLNLAARIVEFDATHPYKAVRLFSPGAGDSIVYQCPAGKRAVIGGNSTTNPVTLGGAWLAHDLGVTRTAKFFHALAATPVGGGNPALGADRQVSITLAAATATASGTSLLIVLEAGEKLVVNCDAAIAGGVVFTHVLELDA
jgi:hypothetical protein